MDVDLDQSVRPDLPTADETDQSQVSVFPLPALDYFVEHFGDHVRYGNGDDDASALPSPPPVPEDGSVEVFGAVLTNADHHLRDLDVQGIDRLFPDTTDCRVLLKKLLWAALEKFGEILEYLIQNPNSSKLKDGITDLHTVFINLHHAINEYRPHQAIKTVIELLRIQKQRKLRHSQFLLQQMTKALKIGFEEQDFDIYMDNAVEEAVCSESADAAEIRRLSDAVKVALDAEL